MSVEAIKNSVEAEIERVVQSVNEWDDRTSPDDYPEHLLITSEELADILRNFADATLESLQAEEKRLRAIALDMQAGYREAIARAETTDKSLDSLCAWLLHRFGPNTPEGREASCRMSPRTALASTGGEHHGN